MNQSTFGHIGPCDLSLFTDRYGLIMVQGYYEKEHTPTATCSVYFGAYFRIAATRSPPGLSR